MPDPKLPKPDDVTTNDPALDDEALDEVSGGIISPQNLVTSEAGSALSARDAASGLPTGKRMHKPFVIH